MCLICKRLGINLRWQPTPEQEAELQPRNEAEAASEEARPLRKKLRSRMEPKAVVVERAPAHDGATTYAAYAVPVSSLPESNGRDTTRQQQHRTPFGMRIYDTTTPSDDTATDADRDRRTALLERRISNSRATNACRARERWRGASRSWRCRSRPGRRVTKEPTRPRRRRGTSSRTYARALNGTSSWESALRDAAKDYNLHQRRHYLEVSWDFEEDMSEGEEEGKPKREFYLHRSPMEKLGKELTWFRLYNVQYFYQEHVNLRACWTRNWQWQGPLPVQGSACVRGKGRKQFMDRCRNHIDKSRLLFAKQGWIPDYPPRYLYEKEIYSPINQGGETPNSMDDYITLESLN
ncbi:hypothetical protein B0H66DRAFT_592495 [Apodospora peruviana]|uniref:Uncharacterized protein n=1 Tax=Apodospora peruviana TaxID=516989 RepID=A0AAE0I281_9PEZI|nr:hypothetical protein B0H66DRAFT_592495 [Apodospora peruviana]